MKVILDANVLISYLLTPREGGTITVVVDACLSGQVELLLPQELRDEIIEAREEKKYLRDNIPLDRLNRLLVLFAFATETPSPIEEISSYASDADDDYLIVYGLVHNVDYLVTGDDGLLSLGQVQNLKIIHPSDFLEILREEGLVDSH
jgi:putative PIN family toxin of toxin-antitoxin system